MYNKCIIGVYTCIYIYIYIYIYVYIYGYKYLYIIYIIYSQNSLCLVSHRIWPKASLMTTSLTSMQLTIETCTQHRERSLNPRVSNPPPLQGPERPLLFSLPATPPDLPSPPTRQWSWAQAMRPRRSLKSAPYLTASGHHTKPQIAACSTSALNSFASMSS